MVSTSKKDIRVKAPMRLILEGWRRIVDAAQMQAIRIVDGNLGVMVSVVIFGQSDKI